MSSTISLFLVYGYVMNEACHDIMFTIEATGREDYFEDEEGNPFGWHFCGNDTGSDTPAAYLGFKLADYSCPARMPLTAEKLAVTPAQRAQVAAMYAKLPRDMRKALTKGSVGLYVIGSLL